MIPMRRALLALSLLLACRHSSTDEPKDPGPPRFHVAGGFIRDPQGRAVVMRGVNLAGAHKNKPYFGPHTEADFKRIAGPWGMNGLRFLVTWAAIEPEEGKYDDAYLDQVATRMQWAKDAGLLVVLDMHQDLYGEGFPGGDGAPKWTCDASHYAGYVPTDPWFLGYTNAHMMACYDHLWSTPSLQDHLAEAWRRLAARLVSFDNVIGFDPLNEPHWGSAKISSFEPERLQPFYEKVVAAVRKSAPLWLAFTEPSSSRNLGIPTRLTPFTFGDVVYSPHSYDSTAESGGGFNPAGHDQLVSNVAGLMDEANALNAALWIGEYGGNPDKPGIASYMDAEYQGAGQVSAGQMYWADDRSDGYGTLRPDGTEKAALLDVIVRPFPDRVAGDPVTYSFDEPSSTFTFVYKPNGDLAAKTEISVPSRRYPKGYQVECGGCTFEKTASRLRILTSPKSPMTILVRP